MYTHFLRIYFISSVQATSALQSVPASQNLVLALYSYTPTSADELSFHKGSVISVISKEGDWWKGELNGQVGLFPSNYVQGLSEQQTSDATRCACSRECPPALSCLPSSLMTLPLPFSSLSPSDNCIGADSVSPEVLNTVSEQERKRQEAIFEVATSERHYVGSLNLVQEVGRFGYYLYLLPL